MFCINCGSRIDSPGSACPKCGQSAEESPSEHAQEKVATADDLMTGRIIGQKYRIEARLGAGGMGTVYRATRIMIGDVVALKLLHPDQLRDPRVIERFRREAQAAARLKHPNVVAIYDFGTAEDGAVFLVMEFVDGQSLRSRIKAEAPFTPLLVNAVVSQVCSALEEAHRQNVVHRDIKPENIMVAERSEEIHVMVLDFGIARILDFASSPLTQTTKVIGTPAYMSPEQCLGEELDGRSDIYSLGVVAFEMLSGVVPFNSPTSTAVVIQHVNQAPPPLRVLNASVPANVEGVIMRALAKRREDRPQSAKGFADELTGAVTGEIVHPPGPKPAPEGASTSPGSEPTKVMPTPATGGRIGAVSREKAQAAGRKWWVALAIAVVLLAGVIGVVSVWNVKPKGGSTNGETTQSPTTAAAPSIEASAAAGRITLGKKLRLEWEARNATRVMLQYAGRQIPVPAVGEYQIRPGKIGAGEADLIALGENGNQATARVDFQVLPSGAMPEAAEAPPTIQASGSPEQVRLGEKLALRWEARNSERVLLRFGGDQVPVPLSGEYQIKPVTVGNGKAELIAFGENGNRASAHVDFQVLPPPVPTKVASAAPTIQASAVADQIRLGQELSLRWSAQNASRVILRYAGRKVRVPLAGQYQILPSQPGSGQADFVAFGAEGQEATSDVNFQVLPHARPTVMVLAPSIQTNGIRAGEVTSNLVQHLMSEGYQVLSTPYYVNSVAAAEQLPISAKPDYVMQANLSATQAQLTQSNTQKVISIFVKNLPQRYDVTVNCSATIQMTQVSNGQILGEGTSSRVFHRSGVGASETNQVALELAQQGLQQVLQAAMNQVPPPK